MKYLLKFGCVVQSPVVMAFLLLFLTVCDALERNSTMVIIHGALVFGLLSIDSASEKNAELERRVSKLEEAK